MKKVLVLLVVALALFGCMPSPLDVTEADVLRTEARQAELDAIQAREQKALMNEIELADALREQELKDAALENAKAAAARAAYWGGLALTVSLVIVFLSVGAAAGIAIYGSGQAIARAAMVKANLIYLDKATGQFPLVLEYAGKGLVTLTDPNTGATLLLNTRNEPERMMIQTAGAVRHVGVLSAAAGKSKDPTGMAMIQPLVIDAEEE
jgi:hypothetical protein